MSPLRSRYLASVIIPTYNMGKYIVESINSVNNQTYGYIEIIVVDDGSTDNTFNIVTKCIHNIERLSPGRTKLITIEHQGRLAAIKAGIKIAEGEYITIVDADDILPADSLNQRIDALIAFAEIDAVYTDAHYMDKWGTIYRRRNSRRVKSIATMLSSMKSPIVGPTLMIKSEFFTRTPEINSSFLRATDKYLVALLLTYGRIRYVPCVTYNYRVYAREKRIAKRVRQWYDIYRIARQFTSGYQLICIVLVQTLFHCCKLIYEIRFIKK
ncbi:MAG: glycosyltransferase [Chitinivibrionales bacterium]|nr:glycosyltransferase [Chitinivibrionales bacterium]